MDMVNLRMKWDTETPPPSVIIPVIKILLFKKAICYSLGQSPFLSQEVSLCGLVIHCGIMVYLRWAYIRGMKN
jgi:hypothetical protein